MTTQDPHEVLLPQESRELTIRGMSYPQAGPMGVAQPAAYPVAQPYPAGQAQPYPGPPAAPYPGAAPYPQAYPAAPQAVSNMK